MKEARYCSLAEVKVDYNMSAIIHKAFPQVYTEDIFSKSWSSVPQLMQSRLEWKLRYKQEFIQFKQHPVE